MRQLKVNLLASDRRATPKAGTGHSPVSFFLSPVLIALIFVMSFGFGRMTLSQTATLALDGLEGIPLLGQMSHLISSPDRKLQGEADDRINVLLLGIGGEGHDGPNLTDTIIVASIKPSTKQVALLSVPRDLLVPTEGHGWRKINAVNAFGELESPGRGGDYARSMLEGLLGIDIPYYVRVDFSGFKQVVDGVGGVDIDVERSFSDFTYPSEQWMTDFGVTTVTFKKGWQHMDGATALRYARSRHGNNGEGSDFARAARQQKVLNALKGKLLAAKTYRNPVAVANTLAALQANITSNIQIGEILRLGKMAQDGGFEISHKVLDNSAGSPLIDSSYGGAYVLVPRNGDWSALRTVATDIFSQAVADTTPATPPPAAIAPEKARIEIMNGTGKSGQARVTATSLSSAGFEIVKIGNADSFDYPRTVIFDLTKGKKPAALARLKQTIGDVESRPNLPRSIAETDKSNVDFLVILGQKDAGESGT